MAIFVSDTFTAAPGTSLASHVGEIGAAWTKHPASAYAGGNALLSPSGDARSSNTSSVVYFASGTPASADYAVQTTFFPATVSASGDNGIALRIDTTADTMYIFVIETGTDALYKLYKRIAGTVTQIGAAQGTITPGTPVTLKLDASGSTLNCYVNNSLVIGPITDTGISAAGRAGLFLFTSGAAPTDTTGFHARSFRANDTAAPLALTLTKPAAYQVFQRSAANTASLVIAGSHNDSSAHDIEARWNGGAFVTIATNVAGGAPFTGTLSNQAAGQGTLTVRFKDNPGVSATVLYVGVGDVFVIAGQSNAVGQATNNQMYQHPTLKAALFANDYNWKELADPTDSFVNQMDVVSNDGSTGNATGVAGGVGGSYWPLLATELLANLRFPVAFVSTALDGTPIPLWQPGSSHQDRTTLYGSLVYRAKQAGGAKAVLWHQGETDAQNGMTTAQYVTQMQTLAAALHTDLGVPLVACKFQSCTAIQGGANGPGTQQGNILAAIAQEWTNDANVKPGPDLSDLVSDDGYHLKTDAAVRIAAARWFVALYAALYAPPPGVKRLAYAGGVN